MFKVGDKVYHIKYGWGIIEEIQDDDILSRFDEYTVWNNSNNNLLSFTEYTLQGFSQERPIVLPETGELCLFSDGEDRTWILKEFICYNLESNLPYITKGNVPYRLIKRIKILD